MFSGKWQGFSVLRGHGVMAGACPGVSGVGRGTGVGHGSMSREERESKGLIPLYPFSPYVTPSILRLETEVGAAIKGVRGKCQSQES
jgi:hypothetical protein